MVNLKQMISADVIEKYQTILRHNPASQVFAPLADAYLERELFLQAEELALSGTQRHPLLPAGFLVLGKVQLKMNKLDEAERALLKCIELSPQNISAHQHLGDLYLAQKNPLEALKAYKMVLLLNPYSVKAKRAVEKLESASALEFEEDTFAMARLSDLKQVQKNQPEVNDGSGGVAKSLKPLLQLADAFLVRGDTEQAASLLREAQQEFGSHPELDARLKKVSGQASLARLKRRDAGAAGSSASGSALTSGSSSGSASRPNEEVPANQTRSSASHYDDMPIGAAVVTSSSPASDRQRRLREAKVQRLNDMLMSVRARRLAQSEI